MIPQTPLKIDLYRADDTFLESIPLMTVLIEAVQRIMGQSLSASHVTITLLLDAVPAAASLTGMPQMINLTPEYGYATIIVKEANKVIYQHPHSVDELIAKTLQLQLKNRYPNENLLKFEVVIPGMTHSHSMYATPPVVGAMNIQPYSDDEPIPFGFKRVAEPPLPQATLTDFRILSVGSEAVAPVKVLINESVYQELIKTRHFSHRVEEGGFLVGRAYQESSTETSYLLQITGALAATHTGASLMHLTYTGDSFMAVKRVLREQRPSERLLGWYHTHLFPASVSMGLSSIDWELHFTTFRIPWQVAGLINLEREQRTLRFYVRHSHLMVPCSWWIIN